MWFRLGTVGAGKILFVNGASSSGKSTLCKALQANLDEPFWHFSIDHLIRDAGILPMKRVQEGDFQWSDLRTPFFEDKLDEYFKNYVSREPDSIIEELQYMLTVAKTGKEIYPFLLFKFTNKYIITCHLSFTFIDFNIYSCCIISISCIYFINCIWYYSISRY